MNMRSGWAWTCSKIKIYNGSRAKASKPHYQNTGSPARRRTRTRFIISTSRPGNRRGTILAMNITERCTRSRRGVRNGSKSKNKPPTTCFPGEDARRVDGVLYNAFHPRRSSAKRRPTTSKIRRPRSRRRKRMFVNYSTRNRRRRRRRSLLRSRRLR